MDAATAGVSVGDKFSCEEFRKRSDMERILEVRSTSEAEEAAWCQNTISGRMSLISYDRLNNPKLFKRLPKEAA